LVEENSAAEFAKGDRRLADTAAPRHFAASAICADGPSGLAVVKIVPELPIYDRLNHFSKAKLALACCAPLISVHIVSFPDCSSK
jgi:hypothetical protein